MPSPSFPLLSFFILSLLSFLFFPLIVKGQTTYTLDTTAYTSFFSNNCNNDSGYYNESKCNPFNNPLLWTPEGIPGANDNLIASSDTLLILVVPYIPAGLIEIGNITIKGNIILNVEGNLTVAGPALCRSQDCLTFEGNSSLLLQHFGTLRGGNAAFYGTSSIIQKSIAPRNAESELLFLRSLTLSGNITAQFMSSTTQLGTVYGLFEEVMIGGDAFVSQLVVNHFSLSGTANVTQLTVYNSASFLGQDYTLGALYSQSSSFIQIDHCPVTISQIGVSDSSTISILTDGTAGTTCSIFSLGLAGSGTINIIGTKDIIINNLHQNTDFRSSAIVSFFQSSSPSSPLLSSSATHVVLQKSYGKGIIHFNGNYTLFAGDSDEFDLTYAVAKIQVNGTVTCRADYKFTFDYQFEFDPHFTLIVPSGHILVINNFTFHIDQPSVILENNSTVRVEDHGVIMGDSYELTGGKKMILLNGQSNPSVIINNFIIAEGSLIEVQEDDEIIGNVGVNGIINLIPRTSFSRVLLVTGNLNVGGSGQLWIPQSVGSDASVIFSPSFLSVTGDINLGGTLNVTLGGVLPAGTTASNYTVEYIPVMNATSGISGKFNIFNGEILYLTAVSTNNSFTLDYKVINNTVSLFLDRSKTDSNNNNEKESWWDEHKWAIISPAIGLVVIIIIGFFVFGASRRAANYNPVQQ